MEESKMMTSEEIRLERHKIKIGFLKFLLGTFTIALLTIGIKYLQDDHDSKLKEFDTIARYVDYALIKDIKLKKSFTQYFATMTTYPEFSSRWKIYDSIVTVDTQKSVDQIKLKYDSILNAKKKFIIDSMKTQFSRLSDNEKKMHFEQAAKIVDKKVIDQQLEITDLAANILASPPETVKPASTRNETLEEFSKNDLAKIIVAFLQKYNVYCFNTARVRDWGGKQKEFKSLKNYDYTQINDMLNKLLRHNVITVGNCNNLELYQINNEDFVKIAFPLKK